MTAPENPSAEQPVEVAVFAEFLARHERGDQPDFEAFCAEHVEHAPKLRRLHARWVELADALQDLPADAAASTEGARGVDVDPGVVIEQLRAAGADPARRYSGDDVIARGGMGEIRKAWDPDLRRTLAMKVLLTAEAETASGSSPQTDARWLSRFLEEAQITAQLDHPGIVPVHDLGFDRDGRAYFTMSLIRGRNLKTIFELVHAGEEGWNRTRALGVLLRVCEAVAFAHTKNVIHRDLKPANVMVGRFGETYVMDWGLARVLGREDRVDFRLRPAAPTMLSSAIRSSRRDLAAEQPDSPLVTMDGDVVGTPAYMAPEQARGEIERVGPPADVYSIGAMLYELLTGHVPFWPAVGKATSRTILARVLDGPPRPLRAVAPQVPPELCAICDKAMAREPEQRYADVQSLAEDLRAYLEGRVVRAHETGTWAEAKKWVLRNRGLSAASAAAVLALVVGLVFSLVERARADEQAAAAEASFKLAFDAVDRMLTRVGDKTLANVPHMDAVRKDLLRDALEFNQVFLASRGDDPTVRAEIAHAHMRVGVIQWKLGELEQAEASQRQAIAGFEAVVRDHPGRAELVGKLVWARNALGTYVLSRGQAEAAQALLEQALRGADAAIASFPGDPALRERKAVVLSNLAVAQHRQAQTEAALESAEHALAIREVLAREHTDELSYQHGAADQCVNVGYMHERLSRPDDAAQVYERGARAMRALLARDPDKRAYRQTLGKLLNNLGIVQMKLPAYGNAVAAETLREAVAINRSLCEDFRGVPAYQSSLGGSLSNLGQALRGSGDLPAARGLFEQAIAETLAAHRAVPEDPQTCMFLGNQYGKLLPTLAQLRQHEPLAQRAEEYAGLEFLPAKTRLYRAAANLASCVTLARGDAELEAADRGRLAEDYALRAVGLLRQAVAGGLLDTAELDDRGFAALRERPDFAELRRR